MSLFFKGKRDVIGLRSKRIRECLSIFVVVSFVLDFILSPVCFAQGATVLNLPAPGVMVPSSVAYVPMTIKGINVYADNALMFDFIIDEGDSDLDREQFNEEANKLIKYFLASLTVSQEQMWVNLSPYEKDRIIPKIFGQTEMGRDLLAQDYMLKQLTSSLIYPEKELGFEFWQRVYQRVTEEFGTTEIPLDTYNKIWIVPDTAKIYEHAKGAFLVESHLKVMLEEDYLALEANQGRVDHGIGDVSRENLRSYKDVTLPIVREILIPEIEREVNEGKIFANLRQINNAMLLAKWYKEHLKESLLGQVYVDQGKTEGVNVEDPEINQKIYEQYVLAFKKGVFDFIREDYDVASNEVIPRKYFSGGYAGNKAQLAKVTGFDPFAENGKYREVNAGVKGVDKAMATRSIPSEGMPDEDSIVMTDEQRNGIVDQLLQSEGLLTQEEIREYSVAYSSNRFQSLPDNEKKYSALLFALMKVNDAQAFDLFWGKEDVSNNRLVSGDQWLDQIYIERIFNQQYVTGKSVSGIAWEKPSAGIDKELEKFRDGRNPKDLKVVVVGCGDGSGGIELDLIKQGYNTLNIDFSGPVGFFKKLLKELSSQKGEEENAFIDYEKRTEFIEGNMLKVLQNLEENSADAVILHLSSHYFDWETTIKIWQESARVAKEGAPVIAKFFSSDDVRADADYSKPDRLIPVTDGDDYGRFYRVQGPDYKPVQLLKRKGIERLLALSGLKAGNEDGYIKQMMLVLDTEGNGRVSMIEANQEIPSGHKRVFINKPWIVYATKDTARREGVQVARSIPSDWIIDEDKIIYDDNTDPTRKRLKTKYATAAVIMDEQGNVLFAKRNSQLGGAWSLPSSFIETENDPNLLRILSPKMEKDLGIQLHQVQTISKRMGYRREEDGQEWQLLMQVVFATVYSGTAGIRGIHEETGEPKYQEIGFFNPRDFLTGKIGSYDLKLAGDCTKSFATTLFGGNYQEFVRAYKSSMDVTTFYQQKGDSVPWGPSRTNQDFLINPLVHYLRTVDKTDVTIADLGSGSGLGGSLRLAKINDEIAGKNLLTTHVEKSSDAMNQFRERLSSEDLKTAGLEEGDFIDYLKSAESNSLDVVYANLTLHYFHWEETLEIFRQIKRVLKPDGRLFFRVFSGTDPKTLKLEKVDEHGLFNATGGNEMRYFGMQELKEIFETFGMTVIAGDITRESKFKDTLIIEAAMNRNDASDGFVNQWGLSMEALTQKYDNMISQRDLKGGIDLNSDMAQLTIQKEGQGLMMPNISNQEIEHYQDVQGFIPVIYNISPVQSLPLILGYVDEKEEKMAKAM